MTVFLIIGSGHLVVAQTAKLSGRIVNQEGYPVAYANVIAHVSKDSLQKKFSITSQKGRYKLNLKKDSLYILRISSLSYKTITDTIRLSQDMEKNYQLEQATQKLAEVIVKKKLPVTVMEDKTIYDADAFRNGNERELYDLLKKMPGVQVDREGNVTVNGKPVRSLTIEGQRFFTGDPRLGVMNIPADAVKEVEVEKNHQQIGMLQGIEDKGTTALNITLKKNHKRFTFGESKVGGGIKNRYAINPKIFYYSPNTSVNFIGDLNNTVQDNSTYSQFQNFNSDFNTLTHHSTNFQASESTNSNNFLASGQNTYSKTIFGAANLNQKIAKHWRMDFSSIAKKGKTQTHRTLNNEYLTQDQSSEFRDSKNEHRLFYTLNDVRFKYDNLDDTQMLVDLFYKHSDGSGLDLIQSNSDAENHFFQTSLNPRNTRFNTTMSYNKRFDYQHLLAVNTEFNYENIQAPENWGFDQPVFNELIPFQPQAGNYNFKNRSTTLNRTARLDAKLYWILDRTNHIYPEAGINYLSTNFSTLAQQKLDNGETNSFRDAGFDNKLAFGLLDAFGGFTYKVMFGKLLMHAGALAHLYSWKALQFEHTEVDKQKSVILPFLRAKYKVSNSEEVSFNYRLTSNFAEAKNFANRFQLTNFNSIYRGNTTLENTLSHSFALHYERNNYYSKWSYNADLNYERSFKRIQNETELQGIDFINTSVMSHLPQRTYSMNFGLYKIIGDFTISLKGNTSLFNYSRQINNEILGYNADDYNYTLGLQYDKKDKPGFDVDFSQYFSSFSSDKGNRTSYMQLKPSFRFNYRFLKDLVFKAHYRFTYYKNQTSKESNTFEIGGASLFYKQEEKPWGIELKANNIFNVQFQESNTTNTFFITDQKTFIQPRTILLSLTYKL